MSNFCEIEKLVELFNTKKDENSDSENEEEPVTEEQRKNGTHTEANKDKRSTTKKNPYSKIEKPSKEEAEARVLTDPDDPKLFFDDEQDDGNSGDWRKCPKWDISYRQKVTASDVYLQMGNKSPATASCENMIISVHLPGEDRQNIDLKVTRNRLDVVSSSFRLGLPLPNPVDPHRGNAQWDKEAEKLIITLDMDREFDYINF